MEAAIVDGSSGCYGAVAGITRVESPIRYARAVLESRHHPFILGPAADEFAKTANLGLVDKSFFTSQHINSGYASAANSGLSDMGPVGAVAVDIHGNLAAAGSSGGIQGKASGTMGGTAVVGAGILANKEVAVVW